MLGHLMEWLYSGVGGIRQEENSIAFKQIKIEPEVVGNLTSANVSYNAPYGKISTKWEKTDKNFTLEVNIPVNTKAVVYFPALPKIELSEENHASFTDAGIENGKTKVAIGSGFYRFNLRYK
jgi:hypothetical protein